MGAVKSFSALLYWLFPGALYVYVACIISPFSNVLNAQSMNVRVIPIHAVVSMHIDDVQYAF